MGTLRLAPASVEDYRRLAERRLPRFLFDYIDGGAYDEATLAANPAAFRALALRQRVLRDVSHVDLSTTLLGETWSMPLGLAPIGMAGMMRRRAEAQAARIAGEAGIPFCLSTVGICSIEEVARATPRPFWFQLYVMRDRGVTAELLQRARQAGCRTLVLTVDLAVLGARYRDVRNGLSGGLGPLARLRAGLVSYLAHPAWLGDVAIGGKPHTFGSLAPYVPKATTPSDFKGWVHDQFDASVTWKDVAALRQDWQGRLVIKGVLGVEDTREAFRCGADAVVVSNHGGRQLDGVPPAIAVLPRIREAVGEGPVLLVDGGVRSGLDVVRARARGADGVLIGRPWIYAMAARGAEGLRVLLQTQQDEMRVAMALTGVTRAGEIGPDCLEG